MASSSHLEAGEAGSITAKLFTDKKSGLLKKTVRVKSNDPERPLVQLLLKVVVRGVFPLVPGDDPVSGKSNPFFPKR
jgi:hypothetical protein